MTFGILKFIRRIEAITNRAVGQYFENVDKNFQAVKDVLKSNTDPAKAIAQLQNENTVLRKELERLKKDKVKNSKTDLLNKVKDLNGINFLATSLDLDAAATKNLAFDMGQLQDDLFLLLVSRGSVG